MSEREREGEGERENREQREKERERKGERERKRERERERERERKEEERERERDILTLTNKYPLPTQICHIRTPAVACICKVNGMLSYAHTRVYAYVCVLNIRGHARAHTPTHNMRHALFIGFCLYFT